MLLLLPPRGGLAPSRTPSFSCTFECTLLVDLTERKSNAQLQDSA